MSAGFTPGPWFVGRSGVSKQIPIMAQDRVVVCELDGFSCDVSADANLIAAAPDMYKALQRIEAEVFPHPNSASVYIDTIRAIANRALAKVSA